MNFRSTTTFFAGFFWSSPVIKALITAKSAAFTVGFLSSKTKVFFAIFADEVMPMWGNFFWMFNFNMLSCGFTNPKIFWSIVVFNSIYVVNNFARFKIPTNCVLHYNSMFKNSTSFVSKWMSVIDYFNITPTIFPTTLPVGMIFSTDRETGLPLIPWIKSLSELISEHSFMSVVHIVSIPYCGLLASNNGIICNRWQYSIGALPKKE